MNAPGSPESSVLIRRALKRVCPLCGRGRMFAGWLRMRDHCDSCGFRFDRNETDYFIGAYTINLIVAELFVVAGLLVTMYVSWPNVPWERLTWILMACLVPAPLITYPYSKSLWLAIDLMFQPPRASEFTNSHAREPQDPPR